MAIPVGETPASESPNSTFLSLGQVTWGEGRSALQLLPAPLPWIAAFQLSGGLECNAAPCCRVREGSQTGYREGPWRCVEGTVPCRTETGWKLRTTTALHL